MNVLLKLFITFLQTNVVFGEYFGMCDNGTDAWTCEDFREMKEHNGEYLEDWLKCLKYDKFKSPLAVSRNEFERQESSWIKANIKFTHINELNDETQVFEPEYWLLVSWRDPRLRLPDECLPQDDKPFVVEDHQLPIDLIEGNLWLPPLDLQGLIYMTARTSFSDDSGGYVGDAGEMGFWRRYNSRLSCPMDFTLFPFDTQDCHFKLTLLVGTNQTIMWDNVINTSDQDILVPNWRVTLAKMDDYDFSDVFGRPAKGVGMTFHVERVWMFHMMQTFLPSLMIMIASVLSVFVPANLVPGRMGLCITAFLSMISLINGTRDDWPPTNNLKAIDYWTGICYLMVFSALTEYCIVLYLMRTIYLGDINKTGQTWRGAKIGAKIKGKHPVDSGWEMNLADRIETLSRLLMPASLILSNIVFWFTVAISH